MLSEGSVVLFSLPDTDQAVGKLRPALVIRQLPGRYSDWLVCMISSKFYQFVSGVDERVMPDDADFQSSGLKKPSLIRASRLAVVEESILIGKLGSIDPKRLDRIKTKICAWIYDA